MVSIANHLNGNTDDVSKLSTEKEGGTYVKQRISQFFQKQREAMRNKNDL